jgi:hypothetical protein
MKAAQGANQDPDILFIQRLSGTAIKYLWLLAVFHDRNGVESCAELNWLTWAADMSHASTTRTIDWLEQDGLVQTLYIRGAKHARLTQKVAQLPMQTLKLMMQNRLVNPQNVELLEIPDLSTGVDKSGPNGSDHQGLMTTTQIKKLETPQNVELLAADGTEGTRVNPQNVDLLVHSPTTTTNYIHSLSTNFSSEDENKKSDFTDQTARLLARLGGISYWDALADVKHAMGEGDQPADILHYIEGWAAWCEQQGLTEGVGKSISHNIRMGDLPPDAPATTNNA